MNPLYRIPEISSFSLSAPLWFANLLSWSIQVALLVAVAALLPRLFRIRQPGVLLAYWRVVLVISFALPFLQPWRHPRITNAMLVERDFAPAVLPSSPHSVSHWYLPNTELLARIVGIALLCGIAVRLVLLAMGLLKLRHFRGASRPVPASAECLVVLDAVRALLSARAEFRLSSLESPVTFGFAAPIVLLPECFLSLEPRFQVAIACHELLHVRRGDWVQHLAEEVLRAVCWFHPAIAWLIARVRLAREQVVDREVVRLTGTRRTYLEALLEFTGGRARIAAMPAPLFLAERQFVERVALMLKEVRMSRRRLIASFAVITCCLALAVMLGVWTFPLRGAPLPAQAPQTGVTGGVSGGVADGASAGVSGGVSGGVAGGINGGISGNAAKMQSGGEPQVAYDSIWTDTVKRGPMARQVRGLGKLVPGENSGTLVAKITVPVFLTADVRADQSATVDTHMGLVKGHVVGIDAGPDGDTRSVSIALDSALPERAAADLSIDATIDIEKLENVLHVGRPIHGAANTTISLFKISKDGSEAQRVAVKLGRSSVNSIEILDGLKEGDKIILSDMSPYDNAERVRLANPKNSQ
jgi:beta-lactamase regulating signal transducer with metallopeptidase domain